MSFIFELNINHAAISILKYIKERDGRTKEEIARYMDESETCSRPTTLKILKRFLDNKIIIDNKKRQNAFASLILNPSFDFKKIEKNLIKEIELVFRDLEK